MEKERFLKIYANLPLALRNDIVIVLKGHGPLTWNAAFIEVANDTELSKIILEKLSNLKII